MAANKRSLKIQNVNGHIASATLSGPAAALPEVFHGYEDYHNPRLKELRRRYKIDRAVKGETNEFRRILKLRHWIHSQWHIDNSQNFGGDAFAILDHAQTGAGFHCAHCMVVQEAVMSAYGLVARNLGVARDWKDTGRAGHHGVNEVWSNDYAKWVLLDAKYDIHFERRGIPMSALELHDAVRKNGGRGVVKVKGIRRRKVPMHNPRQEEGTVHGYYWISYHIRHDQFTQPHWAGGSSLIIPDNKAFRKDTWYRDNAKGRAKHWAYNAGAFIPVENPRQIDWTPGVPSLRVRQLENGNLTVHARGATPNLKQYRYRVGGGAWRASGDGKIRWKLRKGANTLDVHTRNLFGVDGPVVTASVRNR